MENKEPVNVLLVDDQPGKLLSYEVMLAELGENLVAVTSAQEALAYLLKSEVAVILVDVCMPELDGFELARMIREHPRFQKTAIIFVSAVHMSESDYLRGYEAGAVDYLSVPVVPELLRAKVRVFAELYRKTRQLQQLNQELETRVAERTVALERAAARLRSSEQGRSLALAAGNMGSWDYNILSGEWFWDEGQSRIFGVDPSSFVPSAESIAKAIHLEDTERLRDAVKALKPGQEAMDIELRIVQPGGDVRWCQVAAAASFNAEATLVRLSGVTTDITYRKEAETRQTLLAREVDHRAKNALAVVQAIVRLAKRDSIDDYVTAVEGRIGALAQTHELLSKARWEGADILHLIQDEMAPYNDGAERVSASGPAAMLTPEDAQTIAMVLHELATNAAKYGALSAKTGRVDIGWDHSGEKLVLTWKESGGPQIQPPSKKGFGTKIISSSVAGSDKGQVSFDWHQDGLQFRLELNCTVKAIAGSAAPKPVESAAQDAPANPPAGSKARLLLVEDETMVGIFMEELLGELGFEPTCPITNLAEAVAAAERERYDGAVLDMNLRGESVYPLAELLKAQEVPFVFVTGYSRNGIEERFSGVPVVQKPVTSEALAQALYGRFGRSRAPQDRARARA
jgi:two-component sensor histidine kinase/DNA-binding response OmpR family regulator